MKAFFGMLATAVLLVGCAKEQKYETVWKDKVENKSLISTDVNDPYVYVPSMGDTPMQVTASRPFWMGDQKLVTFRFEEKELVAYQVVADERFAGNRVNQNPVLRVKIEHKDYRCTEDQFGECGNKEEEVDDAPWQNRRFFKADFADMQINEVNFLPLELTNAVTGCYGAPSAVVVKNVKIEGDAINVHVEKTWNANIQCADIETMEDFRNLSFTMNYHYSFVKLSSLASPGYRAVNYPFEDQNTFGFFTTERTRLAADGQNTMQSKTVMMNRWNPARSEIKFYMDKGFYLPGMEAVRAATQQGVDTINNSMEKTGSPMRIVLEDGRDKDVGDLRNNFLILVNDPQRSGVIGYGPSIANPLTGEILKAQTVMYYGTMKAMIERTYDEIIAERTRRAEAAASPAASINASVTSGQPINALEGQRLDAHRQLVSQFQMGRPSVNRAVRRGNIDLTSARTSQRIREAMFSHERRSNLREWQEKLRNPQTDDLTRHQAQMEEMSHQCFFHESYMNWGDAISAQITEDELGVDELKPWAQLSDDEKETIINRLMPIVWVPTLVHEVGHNLGLRHNFGGSEDKDNFYNAQERRALGINRDVTFASVMEYSYSSLNQLPVMGKYDIAALRYAYMGKLETKTGAIVDMPAGKTFEQLKAEGGAFAASLKEFRYCTDDHVSVNSGCQRFDEGTNPKEMVQHHIRAYHENYKRRNFRNNRATFQTYYDINYYYSISNTFRNLRSFFENYDRLNSMYPGIFEINWETEIANAPTEEARASMRSTRDFVVGMKEATQLTADFFLEVLTMPDLHCAVVQKGTLNLAAIVPLNVIGNEDATGCFDNANIGLNPAYEVFAETGKFFNHQRHKSLLPGELSAGSHELSQRGIWMDKLLAVRYLTAREFDNPVFDTQRSNYLDFPAFSDKIRGTLLGFMTDRLELETELRRADGTSIQKIPHVFRLGNSHEIKTLVPTNFHRRIGLDRVQKDFRELMIPLVRTSLRTSDRPNETMGLFNALGVVKVSPTTILDPSQVAATAEFRDTNDMLVARFTATNDQVLAGELMAQRDQRMKLDAIGEETVRQIYIARANNQVPTEIPEEHAFAYQAAPSLLTAYLQGMLPDDSVLLSILNIMSI